MTDSFTAATIEGPEGPAPAVIVCEHAANTFPAEFGDLGITAEARSSHVAWDPGALELSRYLSASLGAPLVAGGVSRLLYDCNRPTEAADAIPEKSEIYEIPGNRGLSQAQRAERVARIHDPFRDTLAGVLDSVRPAAMITVHSFTPVYNGRPRAVELGVIHDADTRLADALLERLAASTLRVERNAPYSAADGVTHTLKAHAEPRGLLNVMIEVRNDLLANEAGVARIGATLAAALHAALASTGALPEGAR